MFPNPICSTVHDIREGTLPITLEDLAAVAGPYSDLLRRNDTE